MNDRRFSIAPQQEQKLLRDINEITIHHTETNRNIPLEATLASIARTHKRKFGEDKSCYGKTIAYHYLIQKDGEIVKTRCEYEIGRHNIENNQHSIGISLIGNFNVNKPTDQQYKALNTLIGEIKGRHPNAKIEGHRPEGDANNCPGKKFEMDKIVSQVVKEVKKTAQKSVPFVGGIAYADNVDVEWIRYPQEHRSFDTVNIAMKLKHKGFGKDDLGQRLVNYAYSKGNDLDFVRTLDAENGSRDNKLQSRVRTSAGREESFGLCQIGKQRHKDFIESKDFDDPFKQIDYCRDVRIDARNKGTMPFHAYSARNERGSDIVYQ